ncbi:MAG TPA: thiolase family protein [Solirubrobacteraceae bacterium]|nr:thiolase family protein [Solirubrobacteraceae bacterium]
MPDNDVLLIGGVRTPFSRFGGALRDVPSVELAAFTMRAALDRVGVAPGDVDEVYNGVTIPSEEALEGSIPARVAMLRAGIPEDRLSLTIDRACCSSMTAVHLAARAIRSGESEVILAGGSDNMGRAAFLMPPAIRWGIKRGGPRFKDPMAEPGADIGGKPVAVDAGEVAAEHGVTREDSDRFALRSHREYFRAKGDGYYDDEIVPYAGEHGSLEEDEGPRIDTSEEKLARLRTVFDGPIVTAGNAPGQDAGACFLVLTSRRFAHERGLQALASVHGLGSIARAPREIPVAPAPAIEKALAASDWELDGIDRIEINEAFACVPLTSARVLAGGDPDRERSILERINTNGGAVAIGHPPGASGARILLTLARDLHRRGGGRGVAAICGGLGQGDAAAIGVG